MGLRILIIDDDASTRKVLEKLLRGEGHLVHGCESASSALDYLQTAECDALLTDLVMPDMSGIELISAVRANQPTLRCFIMSGHLRVEGLSEDVVWLEKPIDVDRLLEALDSVVAPRAEG